LGFDFEKEVPHFSTFGKNYSRRFKDTDIFEKIFQHILKEDQNKGFVDPSVAFIDSTHVKANANKQKFTKEVVQVETKCYQAQLDEEINEDRVAHDKSHSCPRLKKK
jgi:hypothetical protein